MTPPTLCTDCRVALPEDDVSWVRDAWNQLRPYCFTCGDAYYAPEPDDDNDAAYEYRRDEEDAR